MVVMFHTEVVTSDTPLLNMLRMPFYFMLSGLFFKDYGGFKTILKKINKLLIPFLFFYTISFFIYVILTKVAGAEISISYFSFFTQKQIVNIALWFLPALFWANVSFLLIYKLSVNIYVLGILSLVVLAISIYVFCEDSTQLPFFIDSGISVLPFFYLGYMLKSTGILYPNKNDKYILLLIPVLLAVAVACYIIGDNPYIGFGSVTILGNPYLFFLGAASIVIAFILICKKIGAVKGIRYIGRYSLIILGVHLEICPLISLLGKQLHIFIPPIVLFIITLALSVLMIPLLTKYFPKFTAQSDLIPSRFIDRFNKFHS